MDRGIILDENQRAIFTKDEFKKELKKLATCLPNMAFFDKFGSSESLAEGVNILYDMFSSANVHDFKSAIDDICKNVELVNDDTNIAALIYNFLEKQQCR